MKTAATNKKVRELISLVRERKLTPRPEFQRRLVWSRDDKNHFLDSVLKGYPFPEIYFADGEVDLESGEGTQLLVDGLQRVSTIIQYFEADPDLRLTTVPQYKDLSPDQKRDFLQYDVAVRDLGLISREEIVEVFKRLNATKYSLLDIEVNNAVYAGKLKVFCEEFASFSFFEEHKVFNSLDYKRMGDLRFALSIVSTMIIGYFNRDDAFEEMLDRYNDDFDVETDVRERIDSVIQFLEECGFGSKSRVWKKADLFSMLVELDVALNMERASLQPSEVVERVEAFYVHSEDAGVDGQSIYSVYYKAALQASNDRINRVRRGVIMNGVIQGYSNEAISMLLRSKGLISA